MAIQIVVAHTLVKDGRAVRFLDADRAGRTITVEGTRGERYPLGVDEAREYYRRLLRAGWKKKEIR